MAWTAATLAGTHAAHAHDDALPLLLEEGGVLTPIRLARALAAVARAGGRGGHAPVAPATPSLVPDFAPAAPLPAGETTLAETLKNADHGVLDWCGDPYEGAHYGRRPAYFYRCVSYARGPFQYTNREDFRYTLPEEPEYGGGVWGGPLFGHKRERPQDEAPEAAGFFAHRDMTAWGPEPDAVALEGVRAPAVDPLAVPKSVGNPILPTEAFYGGSKRHGGRGTPESPALGKGVGMELPLPGYTPYRVYMPDVGVGRYKGLWVPTVHEWEAALQHVPHAQKRHEDLSVSGAGIFVEYYWDREL